MRNVNVTHVNSKIINVTSGYVIWSRESGPKRQITPDYARFNGYKSGCCSEILLSSKMEEIFDDPADATLIIDRLKILADKLKKFADNSSLGVEIIRHFRNTYCWNDMMLIIEQQDMEEMRIFDGQCMSDVKEVIQVYFDQAVEEMKWAFGSVEEMKCAFGYWGSNDDDAYDNVKCVIDLRRLVAEFKEIWELFIDKSIQ